jgi:hypothetical protein
MWLFNQASPAARTSLVYITVGAMTVIWTGVWYVYLYNNHPETPSVYYWCAGILVSGLTLVFIGLALGRLDRSARGPVLPPVEVPSGVLNPQANGGGHTLQDIVPVKAAPVVVLDPAQTAQALARAESGS